MLEVKKWQKCIEFLILRKTTENLFKFQSNIKSFLKAEMASVENETLQIDVLLENKQAISAKSSQHLLPNIPNEEGLHRSPSNRSNRSNKSNKSAVSSKKPLPESPPKAAVDPKSQNDLNSSIGSQKNQKGSKESLGSSKGSNKSLPKEENKENEEKTLEASPEHSPNQKNEGETVKTFFKTSKKSLVFNEEVEEQNEEDEEDNEEETSKKGSNQSQEDEEDEGGSGEEEEESGDEEGNDHDGEEESGEEEDSGEEEESGSISKKNGDSSRDSPTNQKPEEKGRITNGFKDKKERPQGQTFGKEGLDWSKDMSRITEGDGKDEQGSRKSQPNSKRSIESGRQTTKHLALMFFDCREKGKAIGVRLG